MQYRLPPRAGDPRGSLGPPQVSEIYLNLLLTRWATPLDNGRSLFIDLPVEGLQLGHIRGKQILNDAGIYLCKGAKFYHDTR